MTANNCALSFPRIVRYNSQLLKQRRVTNLHKRRLVDRRNQEPNLGAPSFARDGMWTENRRPGIHKHARGNPSFSSTAFAAGDLCQPFYLSAFFPRVVRGRMEKQSPNLVGRCWWSRFTLPCSQQPANLPCTRFTVGT
jgi:hypothetical protein